MLIESEHMLSTLNEYRKCEKCCDVVLKVGDKRFPCHRLILRVAAPYFENMFSGNFEEFNAEIVPLNLLEDTAVEYCINYIYGVDIEVNLDTIMKMLTCADYFMMDTLIDKCLTYIQESIQVNNVVDILFYAIEKNIRSILDCCYSFIETNFSSICTQEQFCEIPYTNFYEIVSNPFKIVTNETEFFRSLEKWIMYNLDSRRQYITELTNFVKKKLVDRTQDFGILNDVLSTNNKGSNVVQGNDIRFSYFGRVFIFTPYQNNRVACIQYDTKSNEIVLHTNKLRKEISSTDFNVTGFKYGIYMFAQVPDTYENKFQYYVAKGGYYASRTPPTETFLPISGMASIESTDNIYISCKGYKEKYALHNDYDAIYCYDVNTSKWYIPPKPDKGIYSASLVSYGNVIYTVGGWKQDGEKVGIGRYDFRDGTFSVVNNDWHSAGQEHIATTRLHNNIYMSTGVDKVISLFDIKMNKFDNNRRIPLQDSYRGHSIAVSDNNILIIGSHPKRTAEIYNLITGTWSERVSLNTFSYPSPVRTVVL